MKNNRLFTSAADGLTAVQLKCIAMTMMLIDHIGAFLLPADSAMYPVCRSIGRLAFPIFCFLIAEGARHTRSLPRYMGRLGVFALVSQPFYSAVHGAPWYSFENTNVFFTLLLGLAAVGSMRQWVPAVLRRLGKKRLAEDPRVCALLAVPAVTVLYGAAYGLHTDYGGYGVTAIVIFYLLRQFPAAAWGSFAVLTFVCYDLGFVRQNYVGQPEIIPCTLYHIFRSRVWETDSAVAFVSARQMLAPLALFPCTLYNGRRGGMSDTSGKNRKYWFYAFYPAHLLVIRLMQFFIR